MTLRIHILRTLLYRALPALAVIAISIIGGVFAIEIAIDLYAQATGHILTGDSDDANLKGALINARDQH